MLTARKTEHNKPGSGSTDGDMEEITMRLYCALAGRKDRNGNEVFVQLFKYMEAAKSLAIILSLAEGTDKEYHVSGTTLCGAEMLVTFKVV